MAGRRRLPDIPYEAPVGDEPATVCRGCDRTWPRRLMRYESGMRCLNCARAWKRKYYRSGRQLRERSLHRNYGIDIETVEKMLRAQAYSCPICLRRLKREYDRGEGGGAREDVAVVDHCHETDVVRGLLCASCNQGLGRFGDDVSRMQRAIEYLEGNATVVALQVTTTRGERIDVRDPSIHELAMEDPQVAAELGALIQKITSVRRRRG